jgi:hypothetical protein
MLAARFASAVTEIARTEGKDELRYINDKIETPGVALRLLGRAGRRGMAVWIHDQRSTADTVVALAGEGEMLPEVKDIQLTLPPLLEGEYNVVWLDTWQGAIIRQDSYHAPAKKVNEPEPLVVLPNCPPFKYDLAVIITRK